MKYEDLPDFPCDACGLCCMGVNQYDHSKYLDRGDGICKNLDLETKKCNIYLTRPIFCRVKDYYMSFLKDKMTWKDWSNRNQEACKYLKKLASEKEKENKDTTAETLKNQEIAKVDM